MKPLADLIKVGLVPIRLPGGLDGVELGGERASWLMQRMFQKAHYEYRGVSKKANYEYRDCPDSICPGGHCITCYVLNIKCRNEIQEKGVR